MADCAKAGIRFPLRKRSLKRKNQDLLQLSRNHERKALGARSPVLARGTRIVLVVRILARQSSRAEASAIRRLKQTPEP